MENSENKENLREMYFIICERKPIIMADLSALKMVNELHNSRGIDNIFLDYNEKFDAIVKYCNMNPIRKIKLDRVNDEYYIMKQIYFAPNDLRIFAYVKSNNEGLEQLRNSLERYHDFYVEERIVKD